MNILSALSAILLLLNLSPKTIENTEVNITSKNPRIISQKEMKVETVKEKVITSPNATDNYKDIVVDITYYTNYDDAMQGGQNDRRGVPLTSHEENVIALPADVPYGSYINIDGMGEFKVVDTGGAIVWLDENTCKVDVFVPNVEVSWLINNTVREQRTARLYFN